MMNWITEITLICLFTLLLLVPFSYKLMHHLKPFAVVVLNGEITVHSVDSPMVLNGSTANTKPCLDTSKW